MFYDNEIPRAFRQPIGLKAISTIFLMTWIFVAVFPLLWMSIMSFKVPMDAFAESPLRVFTGFETRKTNNAFSTLEVVGWLGFLALVYFSPANFFRFLSKCFHWKNQTWVTKFISSILFIALTLSIGFFVVPTVLTVINSLVSYIPLVNKLAVPWLGYTWDSYYSVWVDNSFYNQFLNSILITAGVVFVSLSIGVLAGYGLARSNSNLAFWLLIVALIFRALPHSVLVTGYLPSFLHSAEMLAPLWESTWTGWFFQLFSDSPPTLYGKPWAIIVVLVAINQPFTIWMLRSFFQNVPADLDEAAMVDGCSRFQAFRRVIMPVMWPGLVTTGLFAFLLAYNDYLVTSLLLDAQSQTMVPAITQYFNRETTMTDQIEAIAAAVSITAPLFLLVVVFQKQIVSGLTQGAVKG